MMTSFSLPGLPSLIQLADSSGIPARRRALRESAWLAIWRTVTPRAENIEANRAANVLRVKYRIHVPPNPFKFNCEYFKSQSRQRETENVTTRRNRHILFARDRVAHGRRTDLLPGVEMPQRLAAARVRRLQTSRHRHRKTPSRRRSPLSHRKSVLRRFADISRQSNSCPG